ncbi:MAG TPA: hypothetical protein VKF62_06520 [Planctomycetota bacterium]|nr:hypothetical protein [Planctomycetota bacterium]
MIPLLLSLLPGVADRDPTVVSGCCSGGAPAPWPGYNRAVVWTENLGEAAAEARAEGKFLLVFRLVGDLRTGGT